MAGFKKEAPLGGGVVLEAGDLIMLPQEVEAKQYGTGTVKYEALVCHKVSGGDLTNPVAGEEIGLTPGSFYRTLQPYGVEEGCPIVIKKGEPVTNANDTIGQIYAGANITDKIGGQITDARVQAILDASRASGLHGILKVEDVEEVVVRGYDSAKQQSSSRPEDLTTRKIYHFSFV